MEDIKAAAHNVEDVPVEGLTEAQATAFDDAQRTEPWSQVLQTNTKAIGWCT